MGKNIFSWLFRNLKSRDSQTIEIYFEIMNAMWLFAIWSPGTQLALDITKPIYQYAIALFFFALIVFAAISLISKRVKLRLLVLLMYIGFYLLTGVNMLLTQPFSILSVFFVMQAVLATSLSWKIKAREDT